MRGYTSPISIGLCRMFLVISLLCLLTIGFVRPISAQTECGVERWSIKTGTDADASMVDLTLPPTPTTISALIVMAAPEYHHINPRSSPVETTVWVINASLISYSREEDSDYHLVISDQNGNTMIIEIPHPGCVGDNSPFRADIVRARARFDAQFVATSSFHTTDIPVQVTGVGFFDRIHGQSGVAPNGIELHPVLDIVFNPEVTENVIIYQIDVLSAPVHSCPAINCSEVMHLELGALVEVIGVVPGEGFEGNTDWLHIQVDDVDGFIHGVLAHPQAPEFVSTLEPTTTNVTPSDTSWTCTGDLFNCSDFATCDEVISYFNACPGDPSHLDRNNDGVPCESCSR